MPIKKGKLTQWESEIFELRNVGGTLAQIVDYLKTEGVTANTSEVHKFLHRKRNEELSGKAAVTRRTKRVESDDQSNEVTRAVPSGASEPEPVSSEKPKAGEDNEDVKRLGKTEKADEASPTPVAGNEEPTAKPKGLPKFTWNLEEERKKPILW